VDRRDFRPRLHSSLERIVLFDLILTCRTGLHIGAGKSTDLVGSDLPVIRDAAGRPLVPGSSLRGILRSGIESFCGSLGLAGAAVAPGEDAGGLPKDLVDTWRDLSLVQRLFGAAADVPGGFSYASRLQISDAVSADAVAVELRDGVGINRDSRIAAPGVKFDLEVVPAGTRFTAAVRLKNPADFEVGLLAQALWMLDAGLLLLGGKAARGLGWVSVEVGTPRVLDARSILGRTAPKAKAENLGSVEEKLGAYLTSLQALADSVAASGAESA
jgi:CRISPR/Cas system CSM-associated protein Csm3 (group 7 of RAMP superfamily)